MKRKILSALLLLALLAVCGCAFVPARRDSFQLSPAGHRTSTTFVSPARIKEIKANTCWNLSIDGAVARRQCTQSFPQIWFYKEGDYILLASDQAGKRFEEYCIVQMDASLKSLTVRRIRRWP